MKKILLLACLLMLCMVCSAFAATTTYTGMCDPIVIDQPGEHTIILDNVEIYAGNSPAIRIEAPSSKLTIILKDDSENILHGGTNEWSEYGDGAIANISTALVIRCESAGDGHECGEHCGVLYAKASDTGGGSGSAAIGSRYGEAMSGSITILGGRINADSVSGAGIGSGMRGNMSGTITISGGRIDADSGSGAGIGSGVGGKMSGTITISGGKIDTDTGIGSGKRGEMSGDIIMNGGSFYATTVDNAAIGSGKNGEMSGTITINGGILNVSGESGAGIGSGTGGNMSGTVTINGGYVNASSSGRSVGVGSGYDGEMSGSFIVKGGTVTVSSYESDSDSESGPAIGANGRGTVTEAAVICVDPDAGWIAVKAGPGKDAAAPLANSPFNARTDLKSMLKDASYVEFGPAAPPVTPVPATPVPATPVPATPVPATPVPVTTVPSSVPTSVPEIPATGDSMNLALLAVLAAASMIGMTVILRKKTEA